MSLHRGDERIGEFGRDDRNELALVGDVERVKPKKLAGCRHLGADRNRLLLDGKADA